MSAGLPGHAGWLVGGQVGGQEGEGAPYPPR